MIGEDRIELNDRFIKVFGMLEERDPLRERPLVVEPQVWGETDRAETLLRFAKPLYEDDKLVQAGAYLNARGVLSAREDD